MKRNICVSCLEFRTRLPRSESRGFTLVDCPGQLARHCNDIVLMEPFFVYIACNFKLVDTNKNVPEWSGATGVAGRLQSKCLSSILSDLVGEPTSGKIYHEICHATGMFMKVFWF